MSKQDDGQNGAIDFNTVHCPFCGEKLPEGLLIPPDMTIGHNNKDVNNCNEELTNLGDRVGLASYSENIMNEDGLVGYPEEEPRPDMSQLQKKPFRGRRFSDNQLLSFLQNNYNITEIAQHFGVSRQAIYQRMHKIGKDALVFLLQDRGIKQIGKTLEPPLKTIEQLRFVNEKTIEFLHKEGISEKSYLGALARIEKQNELQFKIMQMVYNMSEIKVFQKIVLDVLREVDPSIKREVVRRFEAKQTMSALVSRSRMKG